MRERRAQPTHRYIYIHIYTERSSSCDHLAREETEGEREEQSCTRERETENRNRELGSGDALFAPLFTPTTSNIHTAMYYRERTERNIDTSTPP